MLKGLVYKQVWLSVMKMPHAHKDTHSMLWAGGKLIPRPWHVESEYKDTAKHASPFANCLELECKQIWFKSKLRCKMNQDDAKQSYAWPRDASLRHGEVRIIKLLGNRLPSSLTAQLLIWCFDSLKSLNLLRQVAKDLPFALACLLLEAGPFTHKNCSAGELFFQDSCYSWQMPMVLQVSET